MNQEHPHVVKIRSNTRKRRGRFAYSLVESAKFLGIFTFFLAISGVIIMWPVIYTKLSYFASPESAVNTALPATTVNDVVPKTTTNIANISTSDSRIVIPKINVEAPIIFMESTKNPDILEAIKNGVAHLAGTAMPGRIGNMFITGHSSYYWWSDGKYNQIFALLPQLKANDLIYVYYKGGEYTYKITDSIVVRPTQIEVMDQTLSPTMSLMTCVPIGTNLKRLIVHADLVSTPPTSLSKIYELSDIPKIPNILPL
ncbi:sortase [Patescibacteria group bacterium]|nr:sortase [Patescibacteria group bacterium]